MIVQYPNEILSKEATDLDQIALKTFLPHFKQLVEKYQTKALGLAAPQTGLSYKLLWIKNFGYMANPKIIKVQGEVGSVESCLSIPNKTFAVKRHKTITVLYRDEKFKLKRETLSGNLAIVAQHEIFHLYGKCLPDYAKELETQDIHEDDLKN